MGRVLFITSFKGGVGKTTVCANLASALCATGRKTLVIDADFGMRSMDIVLGMEDEAVLDSGDILSGACSPSQALIGSDMLYFLPAPTSYEGPISDEKVYNLVDCLRGEFDYILIDSSADMSPSYAAFANAADEAVIISRQQSTAVRAAEKTAVKLSEMGFSEIRLIINDYYQKHAGNGGLLSVLDIVERASVRLIGVIPHNDLVITDQEAGYLAFCKQSDRRVRDYEAAVLNIALRIEGRSIPLLEDVMHPKRRKFYLNKLYSYCLYGNIKS